MLALWAAKLAQLLIRLLGRKGTYFAGKLAIRLCPDFIGRIGRPKLLIGVTGTNGKTTVSNMLNDVFAAWGIKLLNNRYGSNVNAGVASALIESASFTGRCRYELGVLEIDERSAAENIPSPDTPVLLYCRSGMRSMAAAMALLKLGYTRVYDLGALNGWPYGIAW